jgi:hypothetical protein
MGLLVGVVVIVVVVAPPNVANFNCSISVRIISIGIRKTRNTRKRDMATLVIVVKSKEEQGTTMATDITDGQIPTSAYG